ncbi:MAG TPA: aminodeoxychorismate synthase component I [Pyrinomonadaceae bacterium]|nr:aminodeoxychorismate synthase component I [Pyrinomonadaceae bacterium]
MRTETDTTKPLIHEVPLSGDEVLRALLYLSSQRRVSILDSCGARGRSARFLLAGFDPRETVEARGEEIRITQVNQSAGRVARGDALRVLDERLAERFSPQSASAPHPAGGICVATFAYELAHRIEPLRLKAGRRASAELDMTLAFYDALVVHDYQEGSTKIVCAGGERRLEETLEALREAFEIASADRDSAGWDTRAPSPPAIESNLTRDEYVAAVEGIKEHIAAGDIYQANLTQQFTCRLAPKTFPEGVFWRLRRDNPASFAAFMRRGDDVVISASPERFLRVTPSDGSARTVEAWPIKGTRPRGLDAGEDALLRAELLGSEKDRAENVMIVDLMRNDLGRVCRYGSVEVAELCALEEHPTLFHLVSRVRGTLRDGVTAGELLGAAFPCGSITGAPKIRAMEIIAEAETAPRGLSMGAIGYFAADGSLDLNVAIRTMTVRGRVARFNVGGGVVADSSPALEYEESLLKARALVRALGGKL